MSKCPVRSLVVRHKYSATFADAACASRYCSTLVVVVAELTGVSATTGCALAAFTSHLLAARHRTPWAHSSVPSDRIKPHSRPSTPAKNKGKAKDTSAPVQHAPKSAAVRALEATIADLTSSSGRERDAQGGCFCQARTHALASHTPLCAHCGLVLCALNPPHLAFPHCSTPLLSSSAHAAPLESLASELAAVLAREEADAQREREEARETAGAFPQHLPGEARAACSAWRVRRCRMRAAHKVLSLNAKMKHVTVALYTPAPMPFRSLKPAEQIRRTWRRTVRPRAYRREGTPSHTCVAGRMPRARGQTAVGICMRSPHRPRGAEGRPEGA